jgi:RNA polymerase sigma-70 factor, ECF subfamily
MTQVPQPAADGLSNGSAPDRNAVLTRLRERIVAFAASRMQRDAAEDLAQEVLVVLEEKYGHVEAMDELVPLSFQILRFKMRGRERKMVRRGEHKQVPVEELPLADPAQDPEAAAERSQMQERLRTALGKLEGRCREMFRLKLEGKSFPEIQRAMDARSVNTVYTWDYRCRQQLLKLMGGSWEAER